MSLQKVAYGFVPTSITGCALWLDGADPAGNGVVPAQDAQIGTWVDKSGNSRSMTVQGNGAYITYKKVNGINSVWFNNPSANNAYMKNTSFQVIQNGSVFMVFVPLAYSAVWNFLWSWNPTTSNYLVPGMRIQQDNKSLQLYLTFYGANNYGTTNNGITYLSYFDWTNTSGTPLNWSINGTVPPTAGTIGSVINNTSVSEFDLGNDTGATMPYGGYGNMYLSEMIIYNSVLSTNQRQQVEGYLAQKWGLTSSLPVSHPGLGTTLYRSDYTKQNVMRAIPYYTAFSPRSIAGCALWLDAADSSTITLSGSVVTQWSDKSGNGRNTTTIGGSPTYSSNFINLNGTSTYLVGPYVNTTQFLTMFVVAVVDFSQGNYGVYYRLLSVGSTGANDYNNASYASILHNPNSTQIGGYRNFATNYNSVTTNTTFLICLQYDGTNSINYLNGGSASSVASTGSFGTTSYSIGRDVGNTDGGGSYTYWPGKVGEVVIFNAALSTTQQQQVESYLAQKWGLTASLPGGHLNATQPAGAVTTTALANYRTVSVPRRYVSFKWTITAGNTESLIQFSEFQVGFNGTQLVFASPTTATTGSSISWNTGAGEGPAQAVDNNLNTKGLGIGTSGLVLIVTVATPIAANMYRWATANDVTPGRNPTQWTVDGSVDGVTFVRLHTQNTTYSTPSSTFTYTSWIPFTYS